MLDLEPREDAKVTRHFNFSNVSLNETHKVRPPLIPPLLHTNSSVISHRVPLSKILQSVAREESGRSLLLCAFLRAQEESRANT